MGRGEFRNIEKSKQLVSFKDFVYGKLYPTNLDGVLDYHNKAWFIYEVKTKGAPMPIGQKIAIERMVKELSLSGKYCIAIIAEHDVTDPTQMVMLKDCKVTQIKENDQGWRSPKRDITAKELTDLVIAKIEKGALK